MEMNGSQSRRNSECDECSKGASNVAELMEVNRRWKQEYDLLKTKYLREKSELEEENRILKVEVTRLKNELTRLAKIVAEGSHEKLSCCNVRADQASLGNGNVDQLIKEQLAAYREDFKLEHEDKEKIQSEKKSLQERLSQCQRHVQALNLELDTYKKECKRLIEEQEGSRRDIKRHQSVDRCKSYPETSSLSYKDDLLDPMSSIAFPPSMCSKRDGYLSHRDFRNEQFKRGILVRNPSQSRPPRSPTYNITSTTARRLSDSTPPSSPTSPSINQSYRKPDSSRTSCLW